MLDRESARQWFNTWWPKSYGAEMGFTGDVEKGIPGDVSQAYKDQTLLRINIFRRMAGEQPVTENPAYSAKSQAAAVLCAANDALNHFPPTTWKFYTPLAAEGCANSDLAGQIGSSGIVGLMFDGGPENAGTGHRNHLLTSALQQVGVGSSPSIASAKTLVEGASAVWGNDPSALSEDLRYAEPFVAWPAPGYTPYYIVPGRWSIYSSDALTTQASDFNEANVVVSLGLQQLPVRILRAQGGVGLVFTIDGTDEGTTGFVQSVIDAERFSAPKQVTKDVKLHVRVSGIKNRLDGSLWSGLGVYEYDVTLYNPGLAILSGNTSELINISTRSYAGIGSFTQIAGFIIQGKSPRRVLIRAGGPYLKRFGVDQTLNDPILKLYEDKELVQTNDDWGSNANDVSNAVFKTGAVPFDLGSSDAALVTTLRPGVPYTAQVIGAGEQVGNAIVEVYDADDKADSNVINISTRSYVGIGSGVQIAGFILKGSGPRKVLIRAGGPYLMRFGVNNVLADPFMRVFRGNTQIAENDDWGANGGEISEATASAGVVPFDNNSRDSGMVLVLDPGRPYTVQVSGVNGQTGAALVEVFSIH